MSSRKAFGGTRRKLVLAFDVGTTYSGISYSILDPGQVPSVKGVTKFPAQETISGASKIPTIIYYDPQGKVRAVGAEATREGVCEAAEDGNWFKAEWFKLHLRSKLGESKTMNWHNVPPLPPNKNVVDVFSDFLRYLLECARAYIQDTHPNGITLWEGLKDDCHFVLSHPNGWEGKEQSQIRKAAVQANLIHDTVDGHSRLSFVTEGEASLHYAVENGVLSQMDGKGIAIVDAGGGTVDISTYQSSQHSSENLFEETAIPQCYFHGSVFVTFRAKDFLKGHLSESPFLDDLEHIAACFDRTTKGRFKTVEEPYYVKFGSTRDNDATAGIRFGQLKLPGSDVARFFRPSVDCIVQCIVKQKGANPNISHVVLVGGFAASDYLFHELRSILDRQGLSTVRPDNYVNKAVSDGAISFYLDRYVRSRMARFTYGTISRIQLNPNNLEHSRRLNTVQKGVDGVSYVPGWFNILLRKGTAVTETQEYKVPLSVASSECSGARSINAPIMRYVGRAVEPKWQDTEPGNFLTLCSLSTMLPEVVARAHYCEADQNTYFKARFEVALHFGLTEMKASLCWKVDGVEHRSPASIIYDEDD